MGQQELLAAADGQRRAQFAARVGDHEVDMLGGHLLCGYYEVSLVLAVFVVDYDHKLAESEIFDCLGDGVKFNPIHILMLLALRVNEGDEACSHGADGLEFGAQASLRVPSVEPYGHADRKEYHHGPREPRRVHGADEP